MDAIVFGGGCFWCVEAIFSRIEGVISVSPGYSGGHSVNPTYKEVCSGTSGHAEVVKVEFNPDTIDLVTLFSVFFSTHDPTTENRQGADIGTQYRSVIFYNSVQQKEIALNSISAANDTWVRPVVTELEELKEFYPAEDYHHAYFEVNGDEQYCSMTISPKVEKFKEKFSELLKG